MIPPKGLKNEVYPLRHKLYYGFGLDLGDTLSRTTMLTLIRHYKTTSAPKTIVVNPHNSEFETDTGSVCAGMSIIDKMNLTLKFNMTKIGINELVPVHVMWMPIFFSFKEKIQSIDEKTTETVASLLEVVEDATQEDVTPLFNNTKLDVGGTSDRSQPLSTANLTETVAIMNMDTDATMEAVTWDITKFYNALKYYTNKGALKACIGKIRHMTLDSNRRHKMYNLRKFVPRAVRRIVPYSFMAIMVRLAISSEDDAPYHPTTATAGVHVGVTCMAQYHEWHADHDQETM